MFQLVEINQLPVERRLTVRKQIIALHVLGVAIGTVTFDNHPLIIAFKEGFDQPLGNNKTFCSVRLTRFAWNDH